MNNRQFYELYRYEKSQMNHEGFFRELNDKEFDLLVSNSGLCFNLLQELEKTANWELLQRLGLERVRQFFFPNDTFGSYYNFIHIILVIPPEEARLGFIQQYFGEEELKKLKEHDDLWDELKAKLHQTDRIKLQSLIYSDEELQAKSYLKNIKTTIVNTKWHGSDFFSTLPFSPKSIKRNTQFTVPTSVAPQVLSFWSASAKRKSHIEALEEIKQEGRKAHEKNHTKYSGAYHKFWGKNETELYFEKFKDDESFEKAFGKA